MSHPLTERFAYYDADWHLRNSPRRDKSAVCPQCAKGDHSRHGDICCRNTVAPEPADHVCACRVGFVNDPVIPKHIGHTERARLARARMAEEARRMVAAQESDLDRSIREALGDVIADAEEADICA